MIKQLCIPVMLVLMVIAACNKDEVKPYDHPFVHIHVANEDTVFVRFNRKDTVNYNVYYSGKLQFEPMDVKYSVVAGNGLQEGRDYKLINTSDTLHFVQGMFERPVRIAWLESPLAPQQNNSLTIRIISNSKNYTIGLPGPDKLQSSLVIIKN
ncbi:hypothetical protein [uncultured Chitinophaga sp.]|uniref:hypothetical protein n=1 Tax=uncultured Chitinophaga sp. TaxID=339340 RepID=UPI0025F4FAE5|nr:hypothetical protein [uncultured Chitinophaga sp.]